MKNKDIKILSFERCNNEFGESIVQYSAGDSLVSFAFSNVNVQTIDYDMNRIIKEIKDQLEDAKKYTSWSDVCDIFEFQYLWKVGDSHYLTLQTCDDGWDYTIYDKYFNEYDGGQLDMPELSLTEARDTILEDFNLSGSKLFEINFDNVLEDMERVEALGVMNHINWNGHDFYSEPFLSQTAIQPEKLKELRESDDFFVYFDTFGDPNYVQFTMDMYANNNNLYLGLLSYEPEFDNMDNYTDITVNLTNLPYLHAAIDTNNNGNNIISFLTEKGIAEFTGATLASGFCTFPVFKFSEEKLKEICPDEFSVYQKAHGKGVSLDDKMAKAAQNKTDKSIDKNTPHIANER